MDNRDNKAAAKFRHGEITDAILSAFYEVFDRLGYGFLEKVYENALVAELQMRGLNVGQQVAIPVYYKQRLVGEYVADLVVEGKVLVEIKACRELCEEHEAQLLNYLKATSFEVGLLINFGPAPTFKRKIFDNSRKGTLAWLGAHSCFVLSVFVRVCPCPVSVSGYRGGYRHARLAGCA